MLYASEKSDKWGDYEKLMRSVSDKLKGKLKVVLTDISKYKDVEIHDDSLTDKEKQFVHMRRDTLIFQTIELVNSSEGECGVDVLQRRYLHPSG